MQNKPSFDLTRHLVVVGNDAADEVGFGGVEGGHQGVKLLLVEAGHGLAATSLCLKKVKLVKSQVTCGGKCMW